MLTISVAMSSIYFILQKLLKSKVKVGLDGQLEYSNLIVTFYLLWWPEEIFFHAKFFTCGF